MEGARVSGLIRDMKEEVWAQSDPLYTPPRRSKRQTKRPSGLQPPHPNATSEYRKASTPLVYPYNREHGIPVTFPEPHLSDPNFPVRHSSSTMSQNGSSYQSPVYVPFEMDDEKTMYSMSPPFPVPELDVPTSPLPPQRPVVRFANVSPLSSKCSHCEPRGACESCPSSWSCSGVSTSSATLSVFGTLLSRAVDEMRHCKSIFSSWMVTLRR